MNLTLVELLTKAGVPASLAHPTSQEVARHELIELIKVSVDASHRFRRRFGDEACDAVIEEVLSCR